MKLEELKKIAKASTMHIEEDGEDQGMLCISRLTIGHFNKADVDFVSAALKYMLPLIEIAEGLETLLGRPLNLRDASEIVKEIEAKK